jgi:hypothetical protein
LQRSRIGRARTVLPPPIIRPNAEGRTVSEDVTEACKAIASTFSDVDDREDIIRRIDSSNRRLTLIMNTKIRRFKIQALTYSNSKNVTRNTRFKPKRV